MAIVPVDYTVAISTAEGRMALAHEFVEAHANLYEGIEQGSSQAERMDKIFKNCQKEIQQIAKERQQIEKERLERKVAVERKSFKDLLPSRMQDPYQALMDLLDRPGNFLRSRTRGELAALIVVVTLLFFVLQLGFVA